MQQVCEGGAQFAAEDRVGDDFDAGVELVEVLQGFDGLVVVACAEVGEELEEVDHVVEGLGGVSLLAEVFEVFDRDVVVVHLVVEGEHNLVV